VTNPYIVMIILYLALAVLGALVRSDVLSFLRELRYE